MIRLLSPDAWAAGLAVISALAELCIRQTKADQISGAPIVLIGANMPSAAVRPRYSRTAIGAHAQLAPDLPHALSPAPKRIVSKPRDPPHGQPLSASRPAIDRDGGTGSQIIADPRDNPCPGCPPPSHGGWLEFGTAGPIMLE